MKKKLINAFKKQTKVLKRQGSEEDKATDETPATTNGTSELSLEKISSLFATSYTRYERRPSLEEGASCRLPSTPNSHTGSHKDGLAIKATVAGGKIGCLLPVKAASTERRFSFSEENKGKKAKKKGKNREEKVEKEGMEERQETKENESALPSIPSASSTTTTPKLKKKKKKKLAGMEESTVSPGAPSSTATTPKLEKKKLKKSAKMRIESPPNSNGNGIVKAALGNAGDDAWPTMRAFEKTVKPEFSVERARVKAARKLKKRPSAAIVVPEPEPTVPAPALTKIDTVPKSSPHRPATVPMSLHSTPPSRTATVPKTTPSMPATVPMKPSSRQATVPLPMRDTVRQSVVNGCKTDGVVANRSPKNPKHIRFSSESPVKPFTPLPSPKKEPIDNCRPSKSPVKPSTPLPSPPKMPIDNGRSSKSPVKPSTPLPSPKKEPINNGRSVASQSSPIRAVGATIMNGRVKRDSSPEVSTTSSESDDDDQKKESSRRKKLTKKPEVTSSSKAVVTSKMTPSPPKVLAPKRNSIEKSPLERAAMSSGGKKKLLKKEMKKMKSKAVDERMGLEKEDEGEERLRPSSDLLRMVAEKLANSHGLLVFRLISNETRRIAEQQLPHVDSVLHLDEFDDENAFTRDDMTQWWEERRDAEDSSVPEGKDNRSHAQISAYLNMRSVEKRVLRDMDGGMSHPSSAACSVDAVQLLQHPLQTLDAACLLHESQAAAAARLLQQEGKQMREVWLGHCSSKLVRELHRLPSIELFEHRQATINTLEKLPMLQMTELRLDIVDDSVSRAALADHLVNGINLRALEINVAPTGPLDGNTASQYTLFTRRSYDRADYTDDLEWMIPNVEEGDPDPVTLCMPSLEHLATNVANVKLFWQLRDTTLLLRHLRSLRVGTLSTTKELITSIELFADTKESRRYKHPGFFALRDAYETELESVTLRLADRVGVSRLQRETATMFEAIGELPPSLRRLSISLFYNQFAGVCAPFRKWAEPEVAADAPDTGHIHIEEMHLHFERAFDLRGLPVLLPLSIKTLSIAVNYENEDDAKCLGPFIKMLGGLARLECLEDLHIQVWGVQCLQPVVAALSACSALSSRLTRLAVAAYPVDDDAFFEGDAATNWLRSTLSAFPLVRTLGLHAAVLVKMVPEERRSGYSWRNGLAWLANEKLVDGQEKEKMTSSSSSTRSLEDVEIAATPALPALDDGEDYTICPHWEVEYDAEQLVLSPEDEEENVGIEDASYSIPHGSSDEDDGFITDDEEQDHVGDASGDDDLELMEEGLEDETERLEKRQQRRDEKERAAIERGEVREVEEEEGEVIDFDSISDEEDVEPQPGSEFFDDEAAESDREESGDDEEEEQKQEESAASDCSSEDEDKQREEEKMKEEGRRQKRLERKQAKLDDEVDRRKRKRALESEDDDDEMMVIRRAPSNKRKKVIIDSDDE